MTTAIAMSALAYGQSYNYKSYMDSVLKGNLEYAAERLNVDVARAEVVAAKSIQDPSVSFGYDNNSDWSIAMGRAWNVEISKPISLGKVSARTKLANTMLSVSEAALQDYLRNLKADASIAFLDALKARDLALLSRQHYQHIQSFYHSDSLRFVKGDISEVDVLQSHLESVMALQESQSMEADYRNALMLLDQYCGQPQRGTQSVEGTLSAETRIFNLEDLLAQAVANRQDVVAAMRESDASNAEVTLLRRERMPDIELSAAVGYNSRVRNEEAPAPEFVGYSVGLSIPLPVSTLNRGEVRASQYRAQQSQLRVQSVQSAVRVEVMQAYNNYETARLKVESYSNMLLDQSQQVLDGKRYSYLRGETSLLDLLTAQHTYNEVRQAYTETLYDCMTAYVELMRACGM